MKKIFLGLSVSVSLLLAISCSKSPESQAKACMNALFEGNMTTINKLFHPEMAGMFYMVQGQIEAASKEKWEIQDVKAVAGSLPEGAKFAYEISYKNSNNGSMKKDSIYLIEQDGSLYCAMRK